MSTMPSAPRRAPTTLVTMPAMAKPRRLPGRPRSARPGIDSARPDDGGDRAETATNGIQAMATATMPHTIPATARPLRSAGGGAAAGPAMPVAVPATAAGAGRRSAGRPRRRRAVQTWSLW